MMIRALFLLFLFLSVPAFAQFELDPKANKEGEILRKPICGKLINRSKQTILGTLSTASQTIASGDSVKHRDNFRLEAGAEKKFCAAGPFYEGRRLEVVIRTLIPLFDCKTKIDRDIYLDAKPDEYGITKLTATCY